MARKKVAAKKNAAKKGARKSRPDPTDGRWSARFALAAEIAVWAVLLIPPFLVWPGHADSFDLPKLLVSEVVALASLVPLAARLSSPIVSVSGSVGGTAAGVWSLPAVRAVLPLVLVASLGWLVSTHAGHTREALVDLWIGAACLIAWSVGLGAERQRRLVAALLLPASAIALLAILQFHGLYRPFEFSGGEETARLGVTSLIGNAGVLADYLVLPALVAQWLLVRCWRRGRRSLVAAGAVGLMLCLYAAVATQTVVALGAIAVGSVLFWFLVLPRRRAWQAAVAAAVVLALAVLAVAPLRDKVSRAAGDLADGNWDRALAGRLDGWRTAAAMAGEHPLLGVGHGAYAAEFAGTKLALSERGVRFFQGQEQPMFVNAHNEPLEVAAEWGLLGLAALLWGLWVLAGRLRQRAGGDSGDGAVDRALAWAGAAALLVAALGHFPFRVAVVAYPALVFLAWVLRPVEGGGSDASPPAEEPA